MKLNLNLQAFKKFKEFKVGRIAAKALLLLAAFVALAFIFALLRSPLAEADKWLLMTLREGHVSKAPANAAIASVQPVPQAAAQSPKMKVVQLKIPSLVPSSNNAASSVVAGATVRQSYKGIPILSVETPKAGSPAKGDAYIMRWALLGPVPYVKHPQRNGDYCFPESTDMEMVDGEATLDGSKTYGQFKWFNVYSSLTNGKVDLMALFPNDAFVVIYAVAIIDAPAEIKDAILKVGSDDYAKIWVNGERVYRYKDKCRGCIPDSDSSDRFVLKQGQNRIVFKCVQITGGWEFSAKLADKGGAAIYLNRDVSYSSK